VCSQHDNGTLVLNVDGSVINEPMSSRLWWCCS